MAHTPTPVETLLSGNTEITLTISELPEGGNGQTTLDLVMNPAAAENERCTVRIFYSHRYCCTRMLRIFLNADQARAHELSLPDCVSDELINQVKAEIYPQYHFVQDFAPAHRRKLYLMGPYGDNPQANFATTLSFERQE